MKRAIALLAVVGLLLVGCKSNDDDGDGGATGDPTRPASTEPGRGVTADAITIGTTYVDLSAIKEIMNLDHGDYAATFEAVAEWINDTGGINGRRLELVDAPVSPIGTEEGTTTCIELTEDVGVFAVLGTPQPDIVPCYVTDHETALVGGSMSEELLAAAEAPWFTWLASTDRLATKTIEGAADAGVFEGKKVGIVTAAIYEPVVDASVKPALADAGVEIADVGVIDTPPDDPAAATAAAQTIAEKFKSEGIEVVVSVAQTFSTWADGVVQTDYRPVQVTTDSNTVGAWVVLKDDSQLAILEDSVVGSAAPAEVWWNTEAMQECVAQIEERTGTTIVNPIGYVEGEGPSTFVSAQAVCATITLFKAIAEKAGDTLNNDTFLAAGHELGVFQVPGVGGESDYTASDPTGAPPVYLATFDMATKQLVAEPDPVP